MAEKLKSITDSLSELRITVQNLSSRFNSLERSITSNTAPGAGSRANVTQDGGSLDNDQVLLAALHCLLCIVNNDHLWISS